MNRHTSAYLLLVALLFCLLPAPARGQQIYSAPYAANLPGDNPLEWDQSHRLGRIKDLMFDNRMVKYGVAAASQLTNDSVLRTLDNSEAADPLRPTGFMAAYNTRGCYLYIRSDDPQIASAVASGQSQTLEIFIAPQAPGDTGYFRVEVNIVTGQWYATNYQGSGHLYEPLNRYLKVRTEILNDGQAWGTVLFIPWEYLCDRLPFDGHPWAFTFMRWSPTGGVTWGGKVHEQGAWGRIEWQVPPVEERVKIQKTIIKSVWKQYQEQVGLMKRYWLAAGNDPTFYNEHLQPLIQKLNEPEQQIKDIDSLDDQQVATLYERVAQWRDFNQEVAKLRRTYLMHNLITPASP